MRLVERFEAAKALEWFEDFKPTLFFGVPTIYVRLLELPADEARAIGARTRLFVSGSAPLPPHVLEAFRERFGHTILERYGMSETLMLTSNPSKASAAPARWATAAGGLAVGARPAGPTGGDGRRRRGVGEGTEGLPRLLGEPRGDGGGVHRRMVPTGDLGERTPTATSRCAGARPS